MTSRVAEASASSLTTSGWISCGAPVRKSSGSSAGGGDGGGSSLHRSAEGFAMASDELSAKLARRQAINEGALNGEQAVRVFNPYTEFPEFSRREIKEYENTFKKFDIGGDNYIDFNELKRMMETLGAPQTHLALKEMIKEVDEDKDGKISFREFLLIFRKARAGELDSDSGLGTLANLTEIDVEKAGVGGAKNFFEAKIEELSRGKKFEEEIKAEQEERKRLEEERKERLAAFREKAQIFERAVAS